MIQFPVSFDATLKNSFIVLDTNILIGFGLNKDFHRELIEKLSDLEASFIVLDLCLNELNKGVNNKDELYYKKEFIKELELTTINSFLLQKEYEEVLLSYRKKSSTISITDLFLAAVLLKYSKVDNIYLLTEDIKDFPRSIFDREYTFCIEGDDNLKPAMFCKLNYENFKKSIKING